MASGHLERPEVVFAVCCESGEDESIAEIVVECSHGVAGVDDQLGIRRDGRVVEGSMVGRHQHAVETPDVLWSQVDALHLEVVFTDAWRFRDVRIAVLDQRAPIFENLDQFE